MLRAFRGAFIYLVFSAAASGQTPLNACDLAAPYGTVDSTDVQTAINMSLGVTPCTANIIGSGVCNVVVVQRVINASMTGTCTTGTAHSVSLSWVASTSSNIAGYNIYRGTVAGGPYTRLNSTVVSSVSFTDTAVQSGQTYYYVVTAVDTSNNESAYSNQATALIPTP